MAPITEETVNGLKSVIDKLESRVEDLEYRLTHGGEKPKSPAEQMRLILMGPPGAGMLLLSLSISLSIHIHLRTTVRSASSMH